MAVYQYKPNEVKVTVAGVVVTDLAQDGFLSVEYDEDKVTKTIDVNGGGVFNVSASTAGSITISLLGGSPWLAFFTDAAIGGLPLPVIITDKNKYANKVNFACELAMVKQVPSYEFGAEISEVEVVLECINLRAISVPVDIVPTIEL